MRTRSRPTTTSTASSRRVDANMKTVYLTRRNLLTLLSKLDRQRAGEATACTLIKADTQHIKYPMPEEMAIVAVEDEEYYNDRAPGEVHPSDEPR